MAAATAVESSSSPAAPVERTLALIKPSACGKPWIERLYEKVPPAPGAPEDAPVQWDVGSDTRAPDMSDEIISRIQKAKFTIAKQRLLHLTKAQAGQFYAEHDGKPFFDTLTSFMSSGPIMALVLEKENAVKEWRALMGPTNAIKAREQAEQEHPLNEDLWSLRALFGIDGTRNATHGSDSAFSAAREIAFFFPEAETFEKTALLVYPCAVLADQSDKIAEELTAQDFHILARKVCSLQPEHVALFLGSDATEAQLKAASEGPCEVMILDRMGAVPRLKAFCGPPTTVAKESQPGTLRARYGTDDCHLGVAAAQSGLHVEQTVIPAVWPEGLQLQRTLCVIKPGTAQTHYREIVRDITDAGFLILAETRRQLALEEVESFYGEHKGKPFFPGLCAYMASGPVIALALAKPNAIKCWRQLMGPTNTAAAKREKPGCLRAKYGLDGTRNATHGSDSLESAQRELRFYFPDLVVSHPPHSLTGAAAVGFLQKLPVYHCFDPLEKAVVPKTLEAVLVDALAELAKVKPFSQPAACLRWLGDWLINNNPRHGKVREVSTAAAGSSRGGAAAGASAAKPRVLVQEPDDDAPVAVTAGGAAAGAGPAASAPRGAGVAAARALSSSSSSSSAAAAAASAAARTIVFVLGAPGSGKGTQCKQISDTFGYTHLSTGDLLREEIKNGTPLGLEVKAVIESGALVDDELVLRLLQSAIAQKTPASGGGKFLIDGYPRSVPQLLSFEKAVGSPTFVLAFDAAEAVLEERLLERGKTSGRADDNIDSIRHRFKTFVEQSAPVIDFYAKLGCVRSINSERPVGQVFEDVKPLFKPEVVWMVGPPASGKSTLAAKFTAENPHYSHISLQQLVEQEIARETELGKELAAIVGRADIIPTPVIVELIRTVIEQKGPLGRYLLEGAPRNLEQAKALEAAFGKPRFLLHCSAPDALVASRALARKVPAGSVSLDSLVGSSAGAAAGGAAAASGGAGVAASQDTVLSGPTYKTVAAGKQLVQRHLTHFHKQLDSLIDCYSKQARVRVVDTSVGLEATLQQLKSIFTPELVFVLGGPGSGKGTQCAKLVAAFPGLIHLSVGDLLRAEVARGSKHGTTIREYIDSSRIVPMEITLNLLRDTIYSSRGRRFLIDGFPREMTQAKAFEAAVGECSFVLYFDLPIEVMRARLLERAKTSGRSDDKPDIIEGRFKTFLDQTLPVVQAYAGRGRLVPIDASPSPDAVFEQVKPHFASSLVMVLGLPGSGKGVQCANMVREYGYSHLSTGDILRAEVALGSSLGEEIRSAQQEGKLVQDAVVMGLLQEAIEAAPSRKLLLDGFPRSMGQVEAVEKITGAPSHVLFFDVPRDIVKKRLLQRGKSSGRSDDNEAAIAKRFVTFDEQSGPVIAHYSSRGLCRTISGVPAPEVVFSNVKPFFQVTLAVLVGTVGSGRRELARRVGHELGFQTLHITQLLHAEMERGGKHAAAIAGAMALKRTVPMDITLELIQRAVQSSHARKFLLDGFPRTVTAGYPGVHDQVFALEAKIGPVKGCIFLKTSLEARIARAGAKTPGEIAAVKAKVETLQREKMPAVAFFEKLGKQLTIDSSVLDADAVYETARPLLE